MSKIVKSMFKVKAEVWCEVEHEEGKLPDQPVDIYVYPSDGNHVEKVDVGADQWEYIPVSDTP